MASSSAGSGINIVVPVSINIGASFVLPINIPSAIWRDGDFIGLCRQGDNNCDKDCWYNVFDTRRAAGAIDWLGKFGAATPGLYVFRYYRRDSDKAIYSSAAFRAMPSFTSPDFDITEFALTQRATDGNISESCIQLQSIKGGILRGVSIASDGKRYDISGSVSVSSSDDSKIDIQWINDIASATSYPYVITAAAQIGGQLPKQYSGRFGSSTSPNGTFELVRVRAYSSVDPKLSAAVDWSAPYLRHIQTGKLKILSFNIWVSLSHASDNSGVSSVAALIKSSDADIVALQECETDVLIAIATAAGPAYRAHGPSSIIARVPIVAAYIIDGLQVWGCKVEINPGCYIRVFNSHLTAYPYAPYELRDGKSVTAVLRQANEVQTSRIKDAINGVIMHTSFEPHLPTLLCGDHNIPSHLDITDAVLSNAAYAAERRFQPIDIKWPVSVELAKAGFRDAYRVVYPDASLNYGFTWSPWTIWNTPRADEVHDRIDYIYYKSSSPMIGSGSNSSALETKSLSSTIIPLVLRADSIVIHDTIPGGAHWPSDHRALSSIITWSPSLGAVLPRSSATGITSVLSPLSLSVYNPSLSYWKLVTEGKGRCDVLPIFGDVIARNALVNDITEYVDASSVTVIAGIEAIGFLLGMAVATKLDKGFVALRKAGKLPVPADSVVYHDYSRTEKTLELARGSFSAGTRVIVVDEWIETGASVAAAITLIEKGWCYSRHINHVYA